jgi:hypothetical protein
MKKYGMMDNVLLGEDYGRCAFNMMFVHHLMGLLLAEL